MGQFLECQLFIYLFSYFLSNFSEVTLLIPSKDSLINNLESNCFQKSSSTAVVPYANSLDLDETPSYSGSHLDQNCLTLVQHFNRL